MTQQDWLQKAYVLIREQLLTSVPPIGEVIVTYGFPSKGARKFLGECHYEAKKLESVGIQGYKAAIFVHPNQWDTADNVLGTLVHEMCHAATPGAKHRGAFKLLAEAIGMEGKPTVCSPGADLADTLRELTSDIGDFPAAPLKLTGAGKKPGSRLRLWECGCPVKVRVASDEFEATCKVCGKDFEKVEK